MSASGELCEDPLARLRRGPYFLTRRTWCAKPHPSLHCSCRIRSEWINATSERPCVARMNFEVEQGEVLHAFMMFSICRSDLLLTPLNIYKAVKWSQSMKRSLLQHSQWFPRPIRRPLTDHSTLGFLYKKKNSYKNADLVRRVTAGPSLHRTCCSWLLTWGRFCGLRGLRTLRQRVWENNAAPQIQKHVTGMYL